MLRARIARMNEEKQEAEQLARYKLQPKTGFGSQIRNYFLHPDQRVKDQRIAAQKEAGSDKDKKKTLAAFDAELDRIAAALEALL